MNGSAIEIKPNGTVIRLSIQSNLFDVEELQKKNDENLINYGKVKNHKGQIRQIKEFDLTKEQVLKNRKKLVLPYILAPKEDNDVMINLQYEYLVKGNSAAWGKLLIMCFEVTERLLKKYARDYNISIDSENLKNLTTEAAYYVLRRFDAGYLWTQEDKRKQKFLSNYPLGQYYVKNFIYTLGKGVKKVMETKTKKDGEISYEEYVERGRRN